MYFEAQSKKKKNVVDCFIPRKGAAYAYLIAMAIATSIDALAVA
jgi:putative Mn2+ efflux pump MntP